MYIGLRETRYKPVATSSFGGGPRCEGAPTRHAEVADAPEQQDDPDRKRYEPPRIDEGRVGCKHQERDDECDHPGKEQERQQCLPEQPVHRDSFGGPGSECYRGHRRAQSACQASVSSAAQTTDQSLSQPPATDTSGAPTSSTRRGTGPFRLGPGHLARYRADRAADGPTRVATEDTRLR